MEHLAREKSRKYSARPTGQPQHPTRIITAYLQQLPKTLTP